jgi:hypothetical protein
VAERFGVWVVDRLEAVAEAVRREIAIAGRLQCGGHRGTDALGQGVAFRRGVVGELVAAGIASDGVGLLGDACVSGTSQISSPIG